MALSTRDFNAFVQDQITAINSANPNLYDFNVGSVLLALVESNASNAMWIQGLITTLLAIARLQTSTGVNVDTFVQQFGFTRQAGVAATGSVTFSRTVTSTNSFVPVGTIVSTNISGATSVQFSVTADTTNPNFNPSTQQYAFGTGGGTTTLTVPVICLQVGVVGNVGSGTISVINSPLTNVPFVTNASAFTNGADSASDAQTRAAFVLYLNSLFKANLKALQQAIVSAKYQNSVVSRYALVENVDYTTQLTKLGYFYAIVDDGTGSPPSGLVTAVTANIEAARGFTIAYEVHAPASNTAMTFVMTISILTANSGFESAITAAITTALANYIATIPIGGTFYYSKLAEIIYDASPLIVNVPLGSLTMNSGTSDITANVKGVLTFTSGPSNPNITYNLL